MPARCRWLIPSQPRSCLSTYPWSSLLFATEGFGTVPREIVGHHGLAGLRPLQPILVTHRQVNVALASAPVLDHADVRKIVILGGRFVVLAAVDQVHHCNGVFAGRLAKNFDRRIVPEIVG